MRRALLVTSTAALLLSAAQSTSAEARASRLPSFDNCSDLVSFARDGATQPDVPIRAFTGLGLQGSTIYPRKPAAEAPKYPSDGIAVPMPAIAPTAASTTDSAAAGSAAEDFSGTNTQEAGVDEPDVAKSDGKRLFVVVGNELWAIDVTGDAPKTISRLSLEGAGGQLLLRGNRLLLIGPAPSASTSTPTTPSPSPTPASSSTSSGAATPAAKRAQTVAPVAPTPTPAPSVPAPSVVAPDPGNETTRLAEIDVRDTAAMKIVRTMTVPGSAVSARLAGSTIRVVLNSPSTVEPTDTTATTSTTASAARSRAATRKLGLSAFVPKTVLKSRRTHRTFRRLLVPCDDVRHPVAFSGLDLLTVLSIDFDDGLFNVDRDAILASAQVVYGSDTSLYVASTKAEEVDSAADVPKGQVTEIHRFDASKPGETTYAASGRVPGFVQNSYALSEYEGDLRVASTELPPWLPNATTQPSTSSVTVLRQTDKTLAPVGRVGGLGVGERIYATRFIDDVGYLVTFRQTDPLYTLDLSDPTAPKVVGELKINGFSSYLHPLGDHLLLGIGQDATDTGRVQGAQASIFDVSNPAAPARIAALPLSDTGFSATSVGFDPHAFLWWAPAKLAVVPVSGWSVTGGYGRGTSGAAVLKAGRAEGLTPVGKVTHGPDWDQAEIVRSLAVGDRLFTVSDFGVAANRIPTLESLGFDAFSG
jgi:hypothetical protein